MEVVDLLLEACRCDEDDIRNAALETVRNIVELLQSLYEGNDKDTLYRICPWYAELEELYVLHFCEYDDLPLA